MNLSEQEVIQKWKQKHRNQGWQKIGRLNSKGSVPVAYVLPKSKDIQKGRPIVPYVNHVLRSVYRVAGRALSYFLLGHDTSELGLGFNITRTDEFVKTVKRSQLQAVERFGDSFRW